MRTILFTLSFLIFFGGIEAQTGNKKTTEGPGLTAIFFLSIDCPISQKYIGEIQRIDSMFQKQLKIRSVFPGKVNQYDLDNFVAEYKVSFPVEKDEDFRLVKKLNAKVTPEVFLIGSEGQLYYRGAIDNWFFDLGNYRQQITEHYLVNAIDSIIHNSTPPVAMTEAVGCLLQIPTTKTRKQK